MRKASIFLLAIFTFIQINAQPFKQSKSTNVVNEDNIKIGQRYTTADGLIADNVYSIDKDAIGNIWVGTNAGLSVFDGNTFTNYTLPGGTNQNKIQALFCDSLGNVYIGTNDGAFLYNGTDFIEFDSLVGKIVTDILVDGMNRLWFATTNYGIYCKVNTSWFHFTDSTGLSTNRIYCLFESTSGDIYAGGYSNITTHETFLHKFNSIWSTFYVDTTLYNISGINEDEDGNIWFCGNTISGSEYLSKFEDNIFTINHTPFYSTIDAFKYKKTIIFQNDNILISSKFAGIIQYNRTDRNFTSLGNNNNFYYSTTDLLEDNNNLWVATNYGLVYIENYNGYDIHNSYEYLDTNNFNVRFNAMGSDFWNLEGSAKCEIPKGSGKTSLYAGGLWLGGLDAEDSLFLSYSSFGQNDEAYWTGPIANNYDLEYYKKYNRMWKINKSDIDFHIANYSVSNYEMPEVIKNWPGNGDESNGETGIMAPYIDVNNNNTYDPENGDYPNIRGDQAVYSIYNDARLDSSAFGALSLGIEIHCMAYAYSSATNESLNNTFFVNYNILNKSDRDYHDFYLGSWNDYDLGNADDDYTGCDSTRNTFFVYNATNVDGTGQSWAYGENPPAQGITFLNHTMSSFMSYNLGGNYAQTDPGTSSAFYNYMQATWKDSTHLVQGGSGHYSSTDVTRETNFLYENNSGWTEFNANNGAANPAGDRRGVGSIGSFNFNSGESLCVDMAYPWARDTDGSAYTSVAKMLIASDVVRAFYNEQNFSCSYIGEAAIEEISKESGFEIYPNPTTGKLNIYTEYKNYTVEIYNINGQKLVSQEYIKQYDISEYPKGIYIVKIITNEKTMTGKIVLN